MCGIAGFTSSSGQTSLEHASAVRRMIHRMAPRGPDAEGLWKADELVLGHRRLAILDLDHRSDQPMASPDGRYRITFNGEIYNFHALRADLQTQGEIFHTTSD